MSARTLRTARDGAITLGVFAALFLGARAWSAGLADPAMFTGWVLFALVVLLAAYGAKKALPALPLGGSTAWMQVHSWAGVLSVAMFVAHGGARIPTGILESLLALAFVLTAGSGLVGLALARTLPKVLRARGEPILYSRIPALRRELAGKAASLVAPSRALAEHHRLHLAEWFGAPGDTLPHLLGSRMPLQDRIERIESLFRYLTEEEQATAQKLVELVKQKDLLDAHHALQTALRAWTMVHVPVTGVLLVFGAVHAFSAHAFRGGP